MTVELPPEIESRLKEQASAHGLAAEAYAQKLLIEHVSPSPARENSLTKLFAEWRAEDATADPEELARRTAEWEELKRNLNQNRIDMEGPNARRLFP